MNFYAINAVAINGHRYISAGAAVSIDLALTGSAIKSKVASGQGNIAIISMIGQGIVTSAMAPIDRRFQVQAQDRAIRVGIRLNTLYVLPNPRIFYVPHDERGL